MALFVAALGLFAAACSSQPPAPSVSEINEKTGESFTRAREPVELTTTRPGLSAIGRDYLVLSPVTTNSSGTSTTYLWFALGSTIDRAITGADAPTFDSIVLVLDGSMMTFDLMQWNDIAAADPLDPSVRTRASYASRVTQNQLSRIARAETLEAYVTNAEFRSPLYTWAEGSYAEWGSFR